MGLLPHVLASPWYRASRETVFARSAGHTRRIAVGAADYPERQRRRKAGYAAFDFARGLERAAESDHVYGGSARFLSDSAHDQQFSHAEGNLANIDLDGGQWWPKPRDGDAES